MNLSQDRQKVFCHEEHRWICLRAEIYVDGNVIRCLKDDAHLGFTHDLPEIFEQQNEDEK